VRTDGPRSLARLIQLNQPCVALTGAGVSIETCRKPRYVPNGEWTIDPSACLRSPRQRVLLATRPKVVPNHSGRPFVGIASRNSDAEEIIRAYGPVVRGACTVAERSG
jgi:hypothetical protein